MQTSQWADTSSTALPPAMDYDEFAQTRQPDDLFDDDFVPVPEAPPPPIQIQQPPPRPSQHHQLRDHTVRGRGRGFTNRPYERTRPNQNKPPPQANVQPQQQQQQLPPSVPTEPQQPPSSQTNLTSQPTSPSDPNAPPNPTPIPTGPSNPPKPTPSVRGSRLNTGGIQKPKLTEDELSARLAAAKLNNAKREERHRLASADEASFLQREAAEHEKRLQEGIARKAMDNERERNRLRKLAGRGGREWDERKEDAPQGIDGGGRGKGYRRGLGGVRGDGELFGFRRETEGDDFVGRGDFDRGGFRGRERGEPRRGDYGRGRGERGGRSKGRGRGGFAPNHEGKNGPASFQVEDFPALGAPAPIAQPIISTLDEWSIVKPSKGDISSWADQVEAGAPQPPTPPPRELEEEEAVVPEKEQGS